MQDVPMSMHFLQTKIELVNQRNIDLIGKEEVILSEITIDLSEIEAIRECVSDSDDIEPDTCYIYMKSGQSFIVQTPYVIVAALLKKFAFHKRK